MEGMDPTPSASGSGWPSSCVKVFEQKISGSLALDARPALSAAIDYLRPGIGERFELRAEVLRLGSRVASTRMAFSGADGKLLASGAAAYIVS